MEKIIDNCKLNVVRKCEHQFSPYGATMLHLFSESHLTIHTYVKEKVCSMNLYICNPNTDFKEALDVLYKFSKQPYIIKK
jgi:S-adenosylmethionine/arginine decarboxylase-like enzyme